MAKSIATLDNRLAVSDKVKHTLRETINFTPEYLPKRDKHTYIEIIQNVYGSFLFFLPESKNNINI